MVFKPKAKNLIFLVLSLVFVMISLSVPYGLITSIQDGIVITREEYNMLQNFDNKIISGDITQVKASDEEKEKKIHDAVVKFKLFNLFNITNAKVKVINDNKIYAGGNSVGLSLKSKGVVIVGSNFIVTKNGNVNPFKNSKLNIGDIITHINNKEINNVSDISKILENYSHGDELILTVKRAGEVFETGITPAKDVQTNNYKLGIWIRDDAVGVGTLTFVNDETNRFGCLGHSISDVDTGQEFEVSGGEIYKSTVVGVKPGKRGAPGEILGLFVQGRNEQGTIDKNCTYGVYGYLNENSEFIEGKTMMPMGGRLTAKPGKAQILTCINGTDIKPYDIEIIKTNYQNNSSDKSMVLKVTDKELLEKTGGIVQGMSGSPIIQNGKLIGAVTHVFVNDPTKGFGLYLDWMLCE